VIIVTKEFNTTGVCIPERHYMVDTSQKLAAALELIRKGKYFAINRPRQYGKTTTLFLLEKKLLATTEYLPLTQAGQTGISDYNFRDNFIDADRLDMEKILLKFQQFMKEQYSAKDGSFWTGRPPGPPGLY
jgi:predicted AAA+ superfamily ATPase